MRTRVKSLLVGVGLAVMPFWVAAEEQPRSYPECTKEPSEADTKAAQGAFQAGQGSFNEADYPRAITYWEDAYRRDCNAHALLLNLARAYELNGQKRHAVVSLETFNKRKPDSPQSAQIRRRIEKLNEQIANESPAAAPTGTAAAPTGTSTNGKPAPTGTAGDEVPPSEGAGAEKGTRPVLPLIVAGVGGAVFILGGLGWSAAQGEIADIEDECPNRQDCEPEQAAAGNDAKSRANTLGPLALVGAAVGVGGLIWYFLSPRKPPKSKSAIQDRKPYFAPAVAPGFAGLSFSGRF